MEKKQTNKRLQILHKNRSTDNANINRRFYMCGETKTVWNGLTKVIERFLIGSRRRIPLSSQQVYYYRCKSRAVMEGGTRGNL